MRKLYEIDADIEDLMSKVIDPDTGEITDPEALEALLLERDQKIEGVILYRKDVFAELCSVENEIAALTARKKRLAKTCDGVDVYISKALNGEKFSTGKCDVSFRKSEVVDVDDDFCEWASDIENYALHFLRKKETVTADKEKIKKYLKEGGTLKHCKLVTKYNMTIK